MKEKFPTRNYSPLFVALVTTSFSFILCALPLPQEEKRHELSELFLKFGLCLWVNSCGVFTYCIYQMLRLNKECSGESCATYPIV